MYGETLIAFKAFYSQFVKFDLKVENGFFAHVFKADRGKVF